MATICQVLKYDFEEPALTKVHTEVAALKVHTEVAALKEKGLDQANPINFKKLKSAGNCGFPSKGKYSLTSMPTRRIT